MSESSGHQWVVGIAADIKPSAAMIIHDNDHRFSNIQIRRQLSLGEKSSVRYPFHSYLNERSSYAIVSISAVGTRATLHCLGRPVDRE